MKPIDEAARALAPRKSMHPEDRYLVDDARVVFMSIDTGELAPVIASHQMTRNSTTDDPSGYRVWVTCRCQWVSPDVEDPNVPHVEEVKARHIAEAVKAFLLKEDS